MAAKGFLTEACKVTVDAPTATGTSAIDSTVIDMSGWDGVLFIARLGSPASNNNIRLRQSTATGGTYNDATGTLVNHASNNVHMLDVRRPDKQFVRVRVTRGTTSTIDTITAIQYRGRTSAFTQPSSVLEQHMGEVDGTA